ncbi:ABC-type dipeptide/oligopeptide transport system, ATPase component [Thermoproteus uzoniensis 768-20]|uniref:ABC-type dipeptide/oligopeptide transport system, ATPase component n=1 Tax=Thermoproteus uzoniensis (strain 768-20) TaxID=999630 RepID=F2L0W8_THEU7|nr:ABC transporter ATP-binding protein [Thermoproteus uzoniensis]AEA12783.1 ABC-type dipeptide/oligopeptide transport system, ATPase component [Thermoproteus uzoniensis 768-20]
MSSGERIYEVRDLTKVFVTGFLRTVNILALDGVSFDVNEGEILSIVGESGSGKTTLLRILLKALEPTSGEIKYRGRPLKEWRTRDYWREVQAVLQDPYSSFNPFYRVDRILHKTLQKYRPELSEADRTKLIEETLTFVGLTPRDVVGKYPHQFSGGQLQRISIARALLIQPKVLLADEPVSMIDASLRVSVLNLLHEIREKMGLTVLFITHDMGLASYIGDKILVLYKGLMVEYGPVDAVFGKPLHPYTQLLLSSVPKVKERWGSRITSVTIEFSLAGRGCPFADRCPYATETCRSVKPKVVEAEKQHLVACHLYG